MLALENIHEKSAIAIFYERKTEHDENTTGENF